MKALLVILSVLICFDAIAEEKQMYRWRDANNELHVGQIPPKDLPFETITVSAKAQPKKPKDADLALQLERQQKCEQVQANLKILAEDKPVYIKNANGESVLLSKSDILEQQAIAQQQMALFCL